MPAFVVGEGYVGLTSSGNDGTGFVVPCSRRSSGSPALRRFAYRGGGCGWTGRGVMRRVHLQRLMKADVVDLVSEAAPSRCRSSDGRR